MSKDTSVSERLRIAERKKKKREREGGRTGRSFSPLGYRARILTGGTLMPRNVKIV